jgi:hypothetical protein
LSLTQTQLDAYEQDGYILLAGLIPDAVATATAAIMWQCMEARPDDPQTWPDGYAQGLDHPAIVACYTENFLHAAAQLCGDPPEAVGKPGSALAINIFPADGEWKQPTPHIDHAIKEHGHKTFPRPFRVATMTFLNDVAERGGGTAVWPGSHRQIEALARSDEEQYEYMWVLNQHLHRAGLGDPLVLVPKQGDVLFYQCLCAHAGSNNTSPRPRLALNYKW